MHLSDTAITGTSGSLELARVENQHRIVTADQIRTWCANPDTEVIVKPVIDLNEHIHVEGYEVPDRFAEQVTLRDHTCVFPWCTRSARKIDADHVIPYAEGGTTSSDNIAPLCRRHHRLKTHTSWTYTMLEPGSFLWSSPHGYQFLRDHHGTLDVSRDRRGPRAPHRTWSRLTARFARCSTTWGAGRRSTPVVDVPDGGSGEAGGDSGVVDHQPGRVVGEYGVEAALGRVVEAVVVEASVGLVEAAYSEVERLDVDGGGNSVLAHG